MREILFRGKHVDNGEWVYGYYVPACFGRFPCRPAIVPEPNGTWRPIEVKSETIGQYTGLTDKNGRKIFEGDVLKGKFSNYVIRFDEEERAFVYGSSRKGGYIHSLAKYLIGDYKNLRVIGNIHDNPELITCGANSEK